MIESFFVFYTIGLGSLNTSHALQRKPSCFRCFYHPFIGRQTTPPALIAPQRCLYGLRPIYSSVKHCKQVWIGRRTLQRLSFAKLNQEGYRLKKQELTDQSSLADSISGLHPMRPLGEGWQFLTPTHRWQPRAKVLATLRQKICSEFWLFSEFLNFWNLLSHRSPNSLKLGNSPSFWDISVGLRTDSLVPTSLIHKEWQHPIHPHFQYLTHTRVRGAIGEFAQANSHLKYRKAYFISKLHHGHQWVSWISFYF